MEQEASQYLNLFSHFELPYRNPFKLSKGKFKTEDFLNPTILLPPMPKVLKKPVKNKSKGKVEKVYPSEEQGILKEETSDEKKMKMKLGEEDEDIYTQEGQEEEVEEDEIEPWEAGFMKGASGAGQLGKDALTGKPLVGRNIIEAEMGGKLYRFMSETNAQKFKEKILKEKKKLR